ncbi:MAG TPA: hypothetical protein VE870_06810 [Bacteroidales bacterium]|nr:hypothetical protein [Bacteroidales bacterium]
MVLFLISCKKENEEPFITLEPGDITIETYAGDKIIFNIHVFSDISLRKFSISGKYAGENEDILMDSILLTKDFNLEWAFTMFSDRTEDYLLYFSAIDEKGAETKIGRRIRVTGNQLRETTGLKMYSYNNDGLSAFDFETMAPITLNTDSSQRDLQEIQLDNQDEHLTLDIGSPSGCQFVKFVDYDYGNANSITVKNAFSAGIQVSEMTNIKVNDIYLVRLNSAMEGDEYVVLKFTGIYDNDGTSNDFYEFSVKK